MAGACQARILVALALAGSAAGCGRQAGQDGRAGEPLPSGVLAAPALAVAKDIYCACGCGRRLAVCTCGAEHGPIVNSRTMKAFLQQQVESGAPPERIKQEMARKFGKAVLDGEK